MRQPPADRDDTVPLAEACAVRRLVLDALRQWQHEERAATRQRIIDAGRQDTDPLWPHLRDL